MHRGDTHLAACSSVVLEVNGIDHSLGGTKNYICFFLEKAEELIGS